MITGDKRFSRLRSFLWPIQRHELAKFLPMLFLFFLISFNYHILRLTKDALIITAPNSGVEVLPFLKVWAMLPAAIIMTSCFTKLTNYFSKEKVFYVVTSFFLLFYICFLLFIYPHKESLYCDRFADFLQSILPKGANGFIALIRYWMFSLYYIFAEFWSTIMLSILIWGFANDVTTVGESKRFYALFGIGINSSGILAGKFGAKLSLHMKNAANNKILSSADNAWDQTLTIFLVIIIINGICAMIIHRWLHVKQFTIRRHSKHIPMSSQMKKPPKMSLRASLAYIAKSKYLIYLSLIVLTYNIVNNFTEMLWKAQIKAVYPSTSDYTVFTSNITFYVGLLATFGSYFISGNVIRRFGWKTAAFVTPCIAGVTSLGFFYFLFAPQYLPASWSSFGGFSPLMIALFFGSLQNVLIRSCKYTLFDDTKEMAFIPLSSESKIKGKSAIDGLGSRLGKSGSSSVFQILLMLFATPMACSGTIFLFIALVIPVWMRAISSLNRKFVQMTTIPQEALQPNKEEVLKKAEEKEPAGASNI